MQRTEQFEYSINKKPTVLFYRSSVGFFYLEFGFYNISIASP